MTHLSRMVIGGLAMAVVAGCGQATISTGSSLKAGAETYLKEQMVRLQAQGSLADFSPAEFPAPSGYSGIAGYAKSMDSKSGVVKAACIELRILGSSGTVAVYHIATTSAASTLEGNCSSDRSWT